MIIKYTTQVEYNSHMIWKCDMRGSHVTQVTFIVGIRIERIIHGKFHLSHNP